MIKNNEITVVVQGAVSPKTKKCLESVRKYLAGAEIILSTWENSNVEFLKGLYDKLIFSKDPGFCYSDFEKKIPHNLNRQIVSTQAGLTEVSTKYVLKLRTDFFLEGNGFLKYWDIFSQQKDEYKMFNHRLIVSSVFSREFSFTTGNPCPFHPSDFYIFGLTEDVKNYIMDTPLATDSELGDWKFKNPNKKPFTHSTHRYTAEQFLCFNWVKRYYPNIQFDDWTDTTSENISISKKIIRNNFIFLDLEQGQISSKKHKKLLKQHPYENGIINFQIFLSRYNEDFPSKSIKKLIKREKAKFKLTKHLALFVKPFKCVANYLFNIFSVIYYAFLNLVYAIIIKRYI